MTKTRKRRPKAARGGSEKSVVAPHRAVHRRRGRLALLMSAALIVVVAIGYLLFPLLHRSSGPAISAMPASAEGMNVLLLTLDTVRADSLGCYGCADVRTPVIDALAAKGVRFADAVATAPITLPSHATILTGLYPPRHGVRDNGTFRLADAYQTLPEILKQAGYATGAFIGAFVLDGRYGLSQGFDRYEDEMSASRRVSGLRGGPPQRPANVVTDAAIEWLNEHLAREDRQPFFAWVHFFDAHTPYMPPEPYATTYQDKLYLGEIAFIDEQVGRLVDHLHARSLLDRTLIIVVGDHGEGLGQHYEDTHSRLIYESTMAVPMIWQCSALLGEPHVVSDRVVSLVDVMPTVLELLGLAPAASMDGVSLLYADVPADRAVYLETMAPKLNHGWSALFGLRRHNDKYIEAPTAEYYDLASDPKELRNLFSTRASEAGALQRALAELRTKLDAAAEVATTRLEPNAEAIQKLAALGYVASPGDWTHGPAGDPKVLIRLYRKHQQASALRNTERYAEAAALYEVILAQTPDDGTVWASLSLSLGQQQLFDQAIDAILQAIRLQPEERHWIYLARLQMLKGDDDACLASLDQAARIDPGDGEIPFLRGQRLFRLKRYREALPLFEEARRIDPSRMSVSAYAWTGKALAAMGDLEAARQAYVKALHCDPNDARALSELADVQERMQP